MRCDICTNPIHDDQRHVLVLAYPHEDRWAMRVHARCADLANPIEDIAAALKLRSVVRSVGVVP